MTVFPACNMASHSTHRICIAARLLPAQGEPGFFTVIHTISNSVTANTLAVMCMVAETLRVRAPVGCRFQIAAFIGSPEFRYRANKLNEVLFSREKEDLMYLYQIPHPYDDVDMTWVESALPPKTIVLEDPFAVFVAEIGSKTGVTNFKVLRTAPSRFVASSVATDHRQKTMEYVIVRAGIPVRKTANA